MSSFRSPKLFMDRMRYEELWKLVLTMLRTFAAANASPVVMLAPPASVEVAMFFPVSARTSTTFFTSASFLLRTMRSELLRHVRMVQPYWSVGLAPGPPSKKYERS